MNDREVKDLIAKGHILCRVIFEMAGSPKEHVEETLKRYIASIKEDPAYIFLKDYTAPCEERDGVWSTFTESDILVANFEKLNLMCFNLGPASIEITAPEHFDHTAKNMTDWYNDLTSKLHEVSAVVKSLTSENDLLKVNLNRSIRNCVILALPEPKTAEELVLKVGIDKEHLQPFLDAMVREKFVVLEDNKYILNNK